MGMEGLGGVSTYSPGSSTTTVRAPLQSVHPEMALLALMQAEREKAERDAHAPAPVAPPPRLAAAAPAAPAVTRRQNAPTAADAAQALSPNPNEGRVPIYRKLMGGPNAVSGWVNASPGEPGAVFAGYMPAGYREGPTKIMEAQPIGDTMRNNDAADFQLDQARQAAAMPRTLPGGSDFERAKLASALPNTRR